MATAAVQNGRTPIAYGTARSPSGTGPSARVLTRVSLQLATSLPLCLDPDPRLGAIANSFYCISLPRTPPPLRPKKRKAKSLESNEEDEATWNRKAKIIRFMDPKPTHSAIPSYVLLFSPTHLPFLIYSKCSGIVCLITSNA